MDFRDRWQIAGEIGEGGQGKVYRVIPRHMGDAIDNAISESILKISTPTLPAENRKTEVLLLEESILSLLEREDPSNQKALKVLHLPEHARDATLSEERIQREIEAMATVQHSSLLSIEDYDVDDRWYVSPYYHRGAVSGNSEVFAGDFSKALRAFRPLVEGVAKLHAMGRVHRDIKPANVFLTSQDDLILGDFGLVFIVENDRTRISGTFENVGSRDWMPAWAQGLRVEDVSPAFDVFCLGKLLWALVSGRPILQLWYFDRPGNNVEELLREDRNIGYANQLFSKCIVENETDCLRDASELLRAVDTILGKMDQNANLKQPRAKRTCMVCGMGRYEIIVDQNTTAAQNFGINSAGVRVWKIFACTYCGNVQWFTSGSGQKKASWDDLV